MFYYNIFYGQWPLKRYPAGKFPGLILVFFPFYLSSTTTTHIMRLSRKSYNTVQRKDKSLHRSNHIRAFAIKIVFEFPIVTYPLGCGVDSRSGIDDRETSISPSTTSFRLITESLRLSHRRDTTIALVLSASQGIQYVFYLTEFCLYSVNRKCTTITVTRINGW